MKNDFKSIYQNKKVFVTGHTGFKGSWLICWLHLLGSKVKGYALAPENDFDLYPTIKGDELCLSEIADIRDAETLKKSILDFQPDFIFHLAAQPLVRLSYKVPLETFSININGTANVLDALRFLEKPCIAVMVTTDKVYHNQEKNYAYQETDRLGGYDPYSASKAAVELVIDSYRKSFFNPLNYAAHQKSISVARAGNVIGGGDWARDRIIPDIVRALQAEQEIEVRNPNAVRPWQHVLDPLSGYLTLAAKQVEDPIQFADTFNFGPEPSDNLTVKELVNFAIDIWGKGKANFAIENNGYHEALLLQLNISKAKKELDWHPKISAKKAIKLTLDWFKNSTNQQEDIVSTLIRDIKSFEDA